VMSLRDLVERVADGQPVPRSWRSGSPSPSTPARWNRDTLGFSSITTIRPCARLDGELDVCSRRLSTTDRTLGRAIARFTHPLVLPVGQRHGWRHGHRVAGCVYPHRVDVSRSKQTTTTLSLRAGSRISSSSNSFQPRIGLLEQYFSDRARVQAVAGDPAQIGQVISDARARAAERGTMGGRPPGSRGRQPAEFAAGP